MGDLFGTSGVRGIANEEITPELALDLARSMAAELGGSGRILIGRDTRLTGQMLEDALVSGFLSTGFEVEKMGVVPTPAVGFAVSELGMDVGVMITASHNPPEYNGIKFFDSDGMAITQDVERKIEEHYYNRSFEGSDWHSIPEVESIEILRDYLDLLKSEVSLEKDFKVAVDCANGPSSKTTPNLLESLGCKVSTINSQLDGTFPGRSPEPVAEHLQDLSNFVSSTDADIGLAHDGDGDRVAAVDEKGRVVGADELLGLAASYSAEVFAGGVVTTVDASRLIDEQVSEAGYDTFRTEVGDVSVAREMDSRGLSFGGEPSGTWIMGDVHMCPDGTLAAARILEILDGRGVPLSHLVDELPNFPILRDKVGCPDAEKSEIMDMVKERALEEFGDFEDILTVDGVRLEFSSGDWVLIRPSGTEPYIRVTAEAADESRAESLVEKGKELLSK